MSLAMLHVERARTRLPLICTAISLMVLAIFTALCVVSWLLETNSPNLVPPNHPAADVPDAEPPDPYATESWVRHGREF